MKISPEKGRVFCLAVRRLGRFLSININFSCPDTPSDGQLVRTSGRFRGRFNIEEHDIVFQPQFLPNVRTLCRNNRPLGAEIENISAPVLRFWVQKGLSKSEKRSEYPLPYRRKKPYFSKKPTKRVVF